MQPKKQNPIQTKKKNKSLIIGLTGGIATGKSTVSQYLKKQGFPVICADEISKDVVRPNQIAYKKIIKLFGKEVTLKNKELDRKKIATLVFHQPQKRKLLEEIIHPAVQKETDRLIKKLKKQNYSLIFLDIPLLFEVGRDKICDYTICLSAFQYQQIERMQKYRGMTKSEALARIKAQMPLKEKEKRADFVIKNTNDKKNLFKQIQVILKKITP